MLSLRCGISGGCWISGNDGLHFDDELRDDGSWKGGCCCSPMFATHLSRRILLIGRRVYCPQSLYGMLLEPVEPLSLASVILPSAQMRTDLEHQVYIFAKQLITVSKPGLRQKKLILRCCARKHEQMVELMGLHTSEGASLE